MNMKLTAVAASVMLAFRTYQLLGDLPSEKNGVKGGSIFFFCKSGHISNRRAS